MTKELNLKKLKTLKSIRSFILYYIFIKKCMHENY